eukprot:SAG31_NODE_346_length_17349_cov_9.825875_16_plen_101_part_00
MCICRNAEELVYGMNNSGSKVLFADAERIALIEPKMGECPELAAVIGCRLPDGAATSSKVTRYSTVLETAAGKTIPPVDVEQDDDATLFYTSGTTGLSND